MASCLVVHGCGSRGESPLAAYRDLSGVPLSDELRPYVAAGIAALDRPAPDNAVTRTLAAFDSLGAAVERPATQAAAVAAVTARCRREPGALVWLYLLLDNDWRESCRTALDSLLAEWSLSDSTSLPARYVRAWRAMETGDRGEGFRELAPYATRLDTLSRFILELNLVETDGNTRGPRAAIRRLLAVLPEATRVGGCHLAAYFWRALARHLRRVDRLDDALHAVVLAQAMADRAGDRYHAFLIATTRLLIHASRGDRAAVDTLAEACFRVAAREHYSGSLVLVLERRAELLEDTGDFASALIVRKQLLRHALAVADSLNAPRAMWNVADDYLHLGLVDSAGVYVRNAREWIRRCSDRENKEIFPLFDAQYRYYVGDFAAADSLMDLVRLEGGTVWEEADRLHDMIRTGIALGRPTMAYRALDRLRRLQPVLVDNRADQNFRADLELDTADLLARQGEFAAASAALARAERYVDRPGAADRRWVLHRRRGELALLRGDLATARAELLRSRELAPTPLTQRPTSFLLGHVLLADGRTDEARELFASLAADTARGVPYRLRMAARLLLAVCDERDGDPAAGLARCEAVRANLTPHSPADLRLEAAVVHGRLLAALGRYGEAHAVLEDALALVGRRGGGDSDTDLLRYMRDTGRELAELLVGLEADHPTLAGGRPAVRTLATALAVRWAMAGAEGAAPTPAALRHADGPVLVYQVGRRRSFAWCVGPDGVHLAADLPGRRSLKRLLAPVLAGMAAPGRPLDTAALDTLARTLLPILVDRWEGGRVLHVVPDDLLHAVPWAVLPWPEGGTLLDRGPLCEWPLPAPVAPAATPVRPGELTLLAVGLDDSPAPGVPVLRHAREEAVMVASLWSPGRATLLTGGDAAWGDSLATALAHHDVIHVASHLVVTGGLPSRGTLRFPGRDGDVPLTVDQVYRLPLHAALIYLSCCEAAGSSGGSGLSDFAGAFLAAGARAVVASAQPVEDEAAARIAAGFYRRWLAGAGRAAALRGALLALRDAGDRWRHPFYWATFRLMGDGS